MIARAYPGLHRYPASPVRTLPPPPPDLAPDTFAARLYGLLAPVAQYDPLAEWSLLTLCNAIGLSFQLVEDVVRDTPEGPGWSALMDVDRCPPVALPWLAQFAGVRLLPGATDAENRTRIASTDGFHRGTVSAVIAAAQATLTGAKQVILRERDHDPADTPDYAYYLTVITRQAQTPDVNATRQAILAQKPGGIVLDLRVTVGQDYLQLHQENASYAAVKARFATYSAVVNYT